MAIALGDIIQLTDQATYLGQTLLNVYHYRVDAVESLVEYDDMINAWQTHVLAYVVQLQHTTCVHNLIVIRNLTNGLDIFEEAHTTAGTATGDPTPSVVAASIRLIRSTALTRHGSKRLGGLSEVAVDGNGVQSTATATMASIVGAIGSPVVVNGTQDEDFILTPVIVGRYPAGDPDAGQYDLSKINDVAQAQFIRMTSQATRRAGRGA